MTGMQCLVELRTLQTHGGGRIGKLHRRSCALRARIRCRMGRGVCRVLEGMTGACCALSGMYIGIQAHLKPEEWVHRQTVRLITVLKCHCGCHLLHLLLSCALVGRKDGHERIEVRARRTER